MRGSIVVGVMAECRAEPMVGEADEGATLVSDRVDDSTVIMGAGCRDPSDAILTAT